MNSPGESIRAKIKPQTVSISLQGAVGALVISVFSWGLETVTDQWEATQSKLTEMEIQFNSVERKLDRLPAVPGELRREVSALSEHQDELADVLDRILACLQKQRARQRWRDCGEIDARAH